MAELLMEFDAVVRREHFAELCKAAQDRLPKKGLRNIGMTFLAGFAIVLGSAVLFQYYYPHLEYLVDASFAAFLAGVILVGALTISMSKAQQSAMLCENGSYLGPRHIALDDEGITTAGAQGRALTFWSAVLELAEAPHTFLLWTDPGAAMMVPKDAFADESARAKFAAVVVERISRPAETS